MSVVGGCEHKCVCMCEGERHSHTHRAASVQMPDADAPKRSMNDSEERQE